MSFVNGDHHGNAVMCKQVFYFKTSAFKAQEYVDNTSATSETIPTRKNVQ